MAALIPSNKLTRDVEIKILQGLTVNKEEKRKYGFTKYKQADTKAIQCWEARSPYMAIPYHYGLMNFPHLIEYQTKQSSRLNFTGKLRDNQTEPVAAAMKDLQTMRTTTLAFDTGTGKTISSIYMACQIPEIRMVTFTRDTLVGQWEESIRQNIIRPDGSPGNIWVVGTGQWTPPITTQLAVINKKDFSPVGYYLLTDAEAILKSLPDHLTTCLVNPPDFIICLASRVNNLPKFVRDMVSVLILDEIHMLANETGKHAMLSVAPRYIIGCSATPKSTNGYANVVFNVLGQHNHVLRRYQDITVYKIETGILFPETQNKQGDLNFTALIAEVVNHENRNRYIVNETLRLPNKKFFILVSRKNHAKLIEAMLKAVGVSVGLLMGDISSYALCRVLIIVDKKGGVGFDEAKLCKGFDGIDTDILIIATSFCDENMVKQCCGRIRCEKGTIIHMVDKNRTLRSHFSAFNKHYKTYNYTVIEVRDIH